MREQRLEAFGRICELALAGAADRKNQRGDQDRGDDHDDENFKQGEAA